MSATRGLDIALIGYGAMGQMLHALLADHLPAVRIAAVLTPARGAPLSPAAPPAHHDVAGLLACRPSLVVECAGHGALHGAGVAVLQAGVDLLVASVGALADPELHDALVRAAQHSGAKLRIPSGALGGLDALTAARYGGLDTVEYTSRKPPPAWAGTDAEQQLVLHALREPATFFEGTAREAATRYPKNANVAAAVALAGLGFERTRVRLVADPTLTRNRHEIRAQGRFGQLDFATESVALPANPKTSMLAALSLVRSLAQLQGSVVIA